MKVLLKNSLVDMPDGVEELNSNYWTSLTRSGCVGNIKNCFSNRTDRVANYPEYETYFWRMFDTTTEGACVALQTLPFGMDQKFGEKNMNRYPVGPVFANCKELNYFACEAKSRRSELINEEELSVNKLK